MDRKFSVAILMAVALMATTGCISQGKRELLPFTMPPYEDGKPGPAGTIVAHNQVFPNWMIDSDTYKLNYIIYGKNPSDTQLAAVEKVEEVCRNYTHVVHPSDLMTVGVDAIMFGGAGAAGGAVGSLAFTFAKASEYAMYAGASGGFFGGAYGALTLGGKVYTFENCGREILGRFPGYKVQVLLRTPY